MAEEKKDTKNSQSSDDVVTIDVQPFITPLALLISAIFISISFIVGMNMISNSIQESGGVVLGSGETGGGAIPDLPAGDTLPEDPTTGVTSMNDDARLGDENARVALIEFSDYNCGFCGRFHTDGTFDQIVSNYVDSGQIQYVYRDFPGVGGETTAKVASAAECLRRDLGASDEQYFQFIKLKYQNQQANDNETLAGYAEEVGVDRNAFLECAESEKYLDEVYADLDDGTSIGISGTPSFLVGVVQDDGSVDGEIIVGAQPYDSFAAAIERQLSL